MEGSCLCGAVGVKAPGHGEVGLCHCTTCRRWGGPMFAVHVGKEVQFSGAPTVYPSSDWAERGFCAVCGTHLFYHLLPTGEYILSAGLFQDQAFKLTNEIFIDQKPGFYEFKNQTRKLTGQQVFEQFESGAGDTREQS
ncbi:GFA family protein [Luteimonas sp. JM171]|uniref:GFA family protein n=1 Tax=Luteimonas sp. JM171 TaxID=1896164 RepID=UPI000857AC89|nr:GFA family protein [Luteimonas sp. JM171]AOH35610.1 aldehyde-activating protein [Luteimonas sp. JM171]